MIDAPERLEAQPVTAQRVRQQLRPAKPLWTRLVTEPLAIPLTVVVARTPLTPMALTLLSFSLAVLSALLLVQAEPKWLWLGAILHQIALIGDCVDGSIARLKGTGSVRALAMDHFLDNFRLFLCVTALAYGQYQTTGDTSILMWAAFFVFLSVAEMQVPRTMIKIHEAYELYYRASLGPFDYKVLALQRLLEKHKLKVIWFNLHERETLVVLFGVLSGRVELMLVVASVLTIAFHLFRVYFDSVLIRHEILSGEKQYLGHTGSTEAELVRAEEGSQ